MPPVVVLPTYNEAENLDAVVQALRGLAVPLRVLVVDDASPDGTGRLAEDLARGRTDLRVIQREGPRGFGEAQTEGLRAALADGATAIVTMDCDFSHDPATVPALLRALEDADLAIGSRDTWRAGASWAGRLHRRALSATANGFVRALFGLSARDCTSGFRAYRPEVLEHHPLGSPALARLLVPGRGAVLGLATRRDEGSARCPSSSPKDDSARARWACGRSCRAP